MRKILLAIVLSLFILMPTWATAFELTGMSVSTTLTDDDVIGAEQDCYDFNWGSVGIFGRDYYTPTVYVDYELDLGWLVWFPTPKSPPPSYKRDGSRVAFSIEGRMMAMKDLGWCHVGGGLGLALLSHGDVYYLANDAVYGLIAARLRVPINDRFGVDFEADHISAIGRHDQGMNVWKSGLYFMF